MISEAIAAAVEGRPLDFACAHDAMADIMEGRATPAQIAAFLVAIRLKGETVEEIAGMALAMRERCASIRFEGNGRVVDLCGTGGAPLRTFNVSTIAMFVVAAAGVTVAKHGNRGVTSPCGSADLLEALGVRVDLDPADVERILREERLCFMYAPKFHPAMRHAAGPRKEIGVRTVFNILGPLTNPAGARSHVLGVFSEDLVARLSKVAARLDMEHVLVVHGRAGVDEICLCCPTVVAEVSGGTIRHFELRPADFGLARVDPAALAGSNPSEAAAEAIRLLSGMQDGAKRDMILANAAAGIYVGGKAATLEEGVAAAREALDSGRAFERLRHLIRATGGNVSRVDGNGRA